MSPPRSRSTRSLRPAPQRSSDLNTTELHIVGYVPGERGCPVVLKGALNKDWEWDAFDPRLTGPVPSGYVLRTRHQVVDFDYWGLNALASQRFVDICEAFELDVQAVPVKMVQTGRKPTTKPYYYLRWGSWGSVVDLERSDLTFERDLATGQVLHHLYFGDVPILATVEEFVVDEAKVPSAAAFPCLDLGHELVCTDEFRQACESEGLLGLGFEPLTGYRKADFWD